MTRCLCNEVPNHCAKDPSVKVNDEDVRQKNVLSSTILDIMVVPIIDKLSPNFSVIGYSDSERPLLLIQSMT